MSTQLADVLPSVVADSSDARRFEGKPVVGDLYDVRPCGVDVCIEWDFTRVRVGKATADGRVTGRLYGDLADPLVAGARKPLLTGLVVAYMEPDHVLCQDGSVYRVVSVGAREDATLEIAHVVGQFRWSADVVALNKAGSS